MKRKLLKNFRYVLFKKKMFSHEDIRKIIYGTEVIINDLSKLILLISLFILIGNIKVFIFSLCILLSIRTFSGGVHFETNRICFLFTTIFFIITCKVSTSIPSLPPYIYYIIGMGSVVIIALFSPSPSRNRPIISKIKYKRCKLLSILISALWLLLLFHNINNSVLFKCGFSTILLQALQLAFSNISDNIIIFKRRIQNETIF